MDNSKLALEAIRKKLVGKELSYKEIYAIMDQIAEDKLGDVLTTYFVASGYSEGFSDDELYFLTKAMVETGEKLEFTGIVADKHSIGGVPGTRVTMILVPIIAAAGFKIPKSSSRAITTPAGTADAMEVVAKVSFTTKEIYKIIEDTGGCIVWGGAFNIAPADDEIIKIEEPLLFESFDKILVSVMAKKIAFGASHVVIDLPYGRNVKLHREEEANILKRKFEFLGKKFNIKVHAFVHKIDQPAGFGIGPLLEARDSLAVLEQNENRPIFLEELALQASSELLDLCLTDASEKVRNDFREKYKTTQEWAEDILRSGAALQKFRDIVRAQKGNHNISSKDLKPCQNHSWVKADRSGKLTRINSKNVTLIARLLGAPEEKAAGMYFHKKIGDKVEKGEHVVSLYGETPYRLREAIDSLDLFPIFETEK